MDMWGRAYTAGGTGVMGCVFCQAEERASHGGGDGRSGKGVLVRSGFD
jgi:hypothetical protein